MLVTVFFSGLGVIYLAFTLFILIAQLLEDRNERLHNEKIARKMALEDIGSQTDTSV